MAVTSDHHLSDRPYANARDVLPDDLLRAVQAHFTGMLWVPSDRPFPENRRRFVLSLHEQGASITDIARLAGITTRRVRQIITEKKISDTLRTPPVGK